MGYLDDIDEALLRPEMKQELLNYLRNLPIDGLRKKIMLFEWRHYTGGTVTRDDVTFIYPDDG